MLDENRWVPAPSGADSTPRPLPPSGSRQWSWQEDKLFERALVIYPEDTPDRWQRIAGELRGRTPEEVEEHYAALLDDLREIDSGRVELPTYADEASPPWDSSQFALASPPAKPKHGGDADRKKGIPWTEEEHRLFLIGLDRYGKGDWRSISRNVVVTRTPTQVASHAQKYYLRQSSGPKKERKRSSIHDITTADTDRHPPPPPPPGTGSHFPLQGGGFQGYGRPL